MRCRAQASRAFRSMLERSPFRRFPPTPSSAWSRAGTLRCRARDAGRSSGRSRRSSLAAGERRSRRRARGRCCRIRCWSSRCSRARSLSSSGMREIGSGSTVAGDRVIVERARGRQRERREFNRRWLRVDVGRAASARAARLYAASSAGERWEFGDALPRERGGSRSKRCGADRRADGQRRSAYARGIELATVRSGTAWFANEGQQTGAAARRAH